LTISEDNSWSRLEVDWLFFAQDHSITDSRSGVTADCGLDTCILLLRPHTQLSQKVNVKFT
jgi:hypothetical protein